jgi:hypothetical protein
LYEVEKGGEVLAIGPKNLVVVNRSLATNACKRTGVVEVIDDPI